MVGVSYYIDVCSIIDTASKRCNLEQISLFTTHGRWRKRYWLGTFFLRFVYLYQLPGVVSGAPRGYFPLIYYYSYYNHFQIYTAHNIIYNNIIPSKHNTTRHTYILYILVYICTIGIGIIFVHTDQYGKFVFVQINGHLQIIILRQCRVSESCIIYYA